MTVDVNEVLTNIKVLAEQGLDRVDEYLREIYPVDTDGNIEVTEEVKELLLSLTEHPDVNVSISATIDSEKEPA